MSAIAQITAWLLTAISSWGAVPRQPHADEIHQRVAESITAVAYDRDEPPIYQGDTGRARTALLLASIEALESRFLERILNGHCRPDECDSGHAVSGLQIHTGRYGIRLIGDKAAQCFSPMADCYKGAELIDDPVLAHRVGLHVYRTQGIRAYTTGLKAAAQANEWMRANPVPINDSDVMNVVAMN